MFLDILSFRNFERHYLHFKLTRFESSNTSFFSPISSNLNLNELN